MVDRDVGSTSVRLSHRTSIWSSIRRAPSSLRGCSSRCVRSPGHPLMQANICGCDRAAHGLAGARNQDILRKGPILLPRRQVDSIYHEFADRTVIDLGCGTVRLQPDDPPQHIAWQRGSHQTPGSRAFLRLKEGSKSDTHAAEPAFSLSTCQHLGRHLLRSSPTASSKPGRSVQH